MPFSTHRNNLLYGTFYNYSCFWHIIAHFGKIFFHAPIYCKTETKYCVFVCKSACIHVHAQTKRPKASKFGTEILEKSFEKSLKRFFLNRFKVFKMIFKNIFLNFSTNYSFISRLFAFLNGTRDLQLLNLV